MRVDSPTCKAIKKFLNSQILLMVFSGLMTEDLILLKYRVIRITD